MDIDQELHEDRGDFLLRESGHILDVVDRYRKDIATRSTFTAAEAIHLGGDYLAYETDFTLLYQDLALAHLGSNRFAPRLAAELHNKRVQYIVILEQMRQGNFKTLKEYLGREAERFLTGHVNILMLAAYSEEDRRKFGEKLHQMIDVIPDEDQSLSWFPPNLAWQILDSSDDVGEIL